MFIRTSYCLIWCLHHFGFTILSLPLPGLRNPRSSPCSRSRSSSCSRLPGVRSAAQPWTRPVGPGPVGCASRPSGAPSRDRPACLQQSPVTALGPFYGCGSWSELTQIEGGEDGIDQRLVKGRVGRVWIDHAWFGRGRGCKGQLPVRIRDLPALSWEIPVPDTVPASAGRSSTEMESSSLVDTLSFVRVFDCSRTNVVIFCKNRFKRTLLVFFWYFEGQFSLQYPNYRIRNAIPFAPALQLIVHTPAFTMQNSLILAHFVQIREYLSRISAILNGIVSQMPYPVRPVHQSPASFVSGRDHFALCTVLGRVEVNDQFGEGDAWISLTLDKFFFSTKILNRNHCIVVDITFEPLVKHNNFNFFLFLFLFL